MSFSRSCLTVKYTIIFTQYLELDDVGATLYTRNAFWSVILRYTVSSKLEGLVYYLKNPESTINMNVLLILPTVSFIK